jgi:hypothetical protein
MKNKFDFILFPILFAVCLKLAFDLNFPEGKPRMPGEIWSDKAAYYVYLPALFLYGFDARKFPDERIGKKLGYGFDINFKENKILTRMTYGVALLASPFFLVTAWFANNTGPEAGFTLPYQKAMVVAGIFYLVLGLFFLKRFLHRYVTSFIAWLTVMLLLFASNLFFYGLEENLMSHVYSFFLFSLLLNFLPHSSPLPTGRDRPSVGIAIISSLLILIRPTNIMLIFILLFLDVTDWMTMKQRLRMMLHPRFLLISAVVAFVIFVPQFLYWKYLSGHYMYYSYGEQGFSNLFHPPLIAAWFSPLNGLFLYTPLFLFVIAGIILMIFKRNPNGIFLLLFFLALSYLFASWEQWYYGGSFGWRPMVEYYTLFSIPLGIFLQTIFTRGNRWLAIPVMALSGFFLFYNLSLTYRHICFEGSTWSWNEYRRQLANAGMVKPGMNKYTWINDFENHTFSPEIPLTREYSHSGQFAAQISHDTEKMSLLVIPLAYTGLQKPVQRIKTSLNLLVPSTCQNDIKIEIRILESGGDTLYGIARNIDLSALSPCQWKKIVHWFFFPKEINGKKKILSFNLINTGRIDCYLDDVRLNFE